MTAVLREYQPGLGNSLQSAGPAGETLRQVGPGADDEGTVQGPEGAPVALAASLYRVFPSLVVIVSKLQGIQARSGLSHSRGGDVVHPGELSFILQEVIHLGPELDTSLGQLPPLLLVVAL